MDAITGALKDIIAFKNIKIRSKKTLDNLTEEDEPESLLSNLSQKDLLKRLQNIWKMKI